MPLIPAFGLQKQETLCEFKTNVVYRVSSRAVRAIQRNPVSKNKNQTNKNRDRM